VAVINRSLLGPGHSQTFRETVREKGAGVIRSSANTTFEKSKRSERGSASVL